jgi:IclR family KDG regulon transcriptional repressor
MDTTTVKALRVMEALSVSEEPRGVAELSRQLGLTKSNTFRILSTLTEQGYVRSHPDTGRYWLTLKVWEVGARVIERLPVRRVAQPHLKLLFSQLNETILMSVLDLPDVLYIEKMDSDYPVRASARVGHRAPAWRTASGKAMLAFQGEDTLNQLVKESAIDKAEVKRLRGELEQIRQRGYAISVNGSRPGVNSVAAPIWGHERVPVASLSVSGPTERFSTDRMTGISNSVMNAATRISESLGVSSPTFFGNVAFSSATSA